MTVKVERNCQSCHHHSSGPALDKDGSPVTKGNGQYWIWQECAKSWGKPSPESVLKNMCSLYMPKKEMK